MTKRKYRTPESRARTEKLIDALVALFPTDRCSELIKLVLDEEQAKLAAEDPVLIEPLGPEDLKTLDDPEIPEEIREEMKQYASLAGKRISEIPPLTPEDGAEYLEDEACTAAHNIVTSWLNALDKARGESGDKPVRLDSSLLPPPELTKYDGVGWDEWLTNSVLLTAEQIRELMADFAKKRLIPVFNLMIANNPNGFDLTEGLIVAMDKDGFYLPPEVKE